ncbi:coiled-coil domain-containing protein 34-like isoform X2 [Anastrepha obliqua]|uniref:coiled-coil domain-containing protein 34-like isoform X2 n=1 Tax=Anastrepha obliqua TaxID=95512 RepID=UPI002408FBA6|nr:coiled-coil domain-containing protein 34-like isoform X2 [Anastrepha obliqua]
MAFYTTRVDDNGNEIERRHSARSLAISLSASTTSTNTSRINLSSRSCETNGSVRYINPAAFIEKTPDQSETSSMNEENKTQPPSENQSDIVPPLDLQSEDNYPTTRDYTFSYRKHCEASKIVLKPDLAYETWLSAKRKLLSDEAARRRKSEEQKRKEQETRKRLAEEKFQQWLKTKSRQTVSREKIKLQIDQEEKPPKTQIREEEVQAKLEAWEQAKQLEEECRRALKRQEDERRRLMEEQRRQMAAEAWKKWLAEVDKKPRPVPLNRGIFTLRGTISDIFVNPNEWRSTIPIDKD